VQGIFSHLAQAIRTCLDWHSYHEPHAQKRAA
jgi:hypothetical protein